MGLIAPPGMGKTTVLFHLLQQLGKSARTVFIFQTHGTASDFMRNLMADLGLEVSSGDLVEAQSKLNQLLLQESLAGRRLVVVVDEAQNLAEPVFEHLRMLSNFETAHEKLMQIVLSGQPQLAEKIASPSLVQLRQRISMIGKLSPFGVEEVIRYIDHRLEVAGYDQKIPLFTRGALRRIAESSEGIPRNINNLCFNALSLGCVNDQRTIGANLIEEVIRDLDFRTLGPSRSEQKKPVVKSVHRDAVHVPEARWATKPMGHWLPRLTLASLLVVATLLVYTAIGRIKSPQPVQGAIPAFAAKPATPSQSASAPPIADASSKSLDTAAPVSIAKPEDSVNPLESEPPKTEAPAKNVRTVRIEPNQTLYGISREKLGSFNDGDLKTLQSLNPWLKNPNFIRAGQTLLIPSASSGSNSMDPNKQETLVEADQQ
jgi:type II secretory pathway predicted ATPase ExeA/LysM repeat protein